MTEVWPAHVYNRLERVPKDSIRAPSCLLLMPFEQKFDDIATLIHDTVNEVFAQFRDFFSLPEVNRLDWVSSSGAIQQQIWQKILEADLVICDLTDYNRNVMFESGVAAAWKDAAQVIFLKDRSFTVPAPFDTAPMRYTEYDRTSYVGIRQFKQRLATLIRDVFIAFPDRATAESPSISPVFEMSFAEGQDNLAIVTAPFAHRRVIDGLLEFGSLWMFPHSWATIGKDRFHEFQLEFTATFRNPLPNRDCWVGVGLRSQHYYAQFAHLLYLKHDGSIVIAEPNEIPPDFYKDNQLRGPTPVDPAADHKFHVSFTATTLGVRVDEFSHEFRLAEMSKVLPPGLIRFQASGTWMGLRSFSLRSA